MNDNPDQKENKEIFNGESVGSKNKPDFCCSKCSCLLLRSGQGIYVEQEINLPLMLQSPGNDENESVKNKQDGEK